MPGTQSVGCMHHCLALPQPGEAHGGKVGGKVTQGMNGTGATQGDAIVGVISRECALGGGCCEDEGCPKQAQGSVHWPQPVPHLEGLRQLLLIGAIDGTRDL